jgi:cytochrome P450
MRLLHRLRRIPDQIRGRGPFAGTLPVERLPLVRTGLVTARSFRTPPEARERAVYLQRVFAETLRLNNALYFLPRVARRDTTVTTSRGTITIPADTHLVLATYHMNRCERHWGMEATGYPATAFAPDRSGAKNMEARGRSSKDNLHFGFGHGPRVCVGKHFSEAEAFVCLTLSLRRFKFRAVYPRAEADSGVSTRPRDRVDVELSLRCE